MEILDHNNFRLGKMVEGGTYNLSCYVGGGETVYNFTWKIDGVTLTSQTSQYLLVSNVNRRDDQKTYNCSAVGMNGQRSIEASISPGVSCKESWIKCRIRGTCSTVGHFMNEVII